MAPVSLAPPRSRGYRAVVSGRALSALALALALTLPSCRDKAAEVVVTETRPATTRDKAVKLDSTSDERFRDTRPSPVKAGDTPDGWLALPATQFRLLNYRFGDSGMGEVWVSKASGTVLDNVNRWLKQFDAPAIDGNALAALKEVPLAGTPGVWVEAAGDYASGMGSPVKPGFALAGVVASVNGSIVTVKMVGPKAEVEAARETLANFARDLKMTP
jgi:hypothetical protein